MKKILFLLLVLVQIVSVNKLNADCCDCPANKLCKNQFVAITCSRENGGGTIYKLQDNNPGANQGKEAPNSSILCPFCKHPPYRHMENSSCRQSVNDACACSVTVPDRPPFSCSPSPTLKGN